MVKRFKRRGWRGIKRRLIKGEVSLMMADWPKHVGHSPRGLKTIWKGKWGKADPGTDTWQLAGTQVHLYIGCLGHPKITLNSA
ncbi:hypothetical protein GDO86_010196 [Hymenochirus boettgeri]|uniref:Uncharacterized protein n=1 Tax=Hymenochirus boettgeri TaxID=247094 RepID=A0A8T2JPF2_9PIPI|nr:hypothetical protein GDO86_010196 [Hymenochirus boettgeri]